MARTFFDLPRDIVDKIMDMRVSLEIDADPYLKMTHTADLCYYCGCKTVDRRIRYNKINYKFCNFCIGYNNTFPIATPGASDHSRSYNLYKNYLGFQGAELVQFENFFHDVMDEEARASIKDPELFRLIFETYLKYLPSDDDDDGYAFDGGESEDEVESA